MVKEAPNFLNCFYIADGKEMGKREGYAWLLKSNHQTQLKPFQTTLQFRILVFHQGDTNSIRRSFFTDSRFFVSLKTLIRVLKPLKKSQIPCL